MSELAGIELLTLLLYSPGEKNKKNEEIRGITKLVKLIFLLTREANFENKIIDNFEYEAYDFGPYSSEVYDYLETMKVKNLLKIEEIQFTDFREIFDDYIEKDVTNNYIDIIDKKERKVEIYSLNDLGLKFAEWLISKKKVSEETISQIASIKKKYNKMSLPQLLKYVYEKYPKETEKSKIIDEVLGYERRKELTPFEREK